MPWLTEGSQVEIGVALERFPDLTVPAGSPGTIVIAENRFVVVALDESLPGSEAGGSEVEWTLPEDLDCNALASVVAQAEGLSLTDARVRIACHVAGALGLGAYVNTGGGMMCVETTADGETISFGEESADADGLTWCVGHPGSGDATIYWVAADTRDWSVSAWLSAIELVLSTPSPPRTLRLNDTRLEVSSEDC